MSFMQAFGTLHKFRKIHFPILKVFREDALHMVMRASLESSNLDKEVQHETGRKKHGAECSFLFIALTHNLPNLIVVLLTFKDLSYFFIPLSFSQSSRLFRLLSFIAEKFFDNGILYSFSILKIVLIINLVIFRLNLRFEIVINLNFRLLSIHSYKKTFLKIND